MGKVIITPEELAKSAAKYRKDLLVMAVIALESSLKHMSLRTGIRYKETVGELSGGIEIGPYDEKREDDSDVKIVGRTLETHLGSVIKKFSPNSVYQSIYGNSIISGDGLKNVEITKAVLAYLMKKLSQSLNNNLWSAVRKDTGTLTKDLFDGFDTILQKEITDGEVAVAKRNLYEFTDVIGPNNAVDILKGFWRAGSDELQDIPTKMYIPKSIYNAYNDDYQQTVGSIPYNREFKKTFLEGSDDLCELVPLANKKGSPFIQLTTKGNMLVGTDQQSDVEKITVEKHHPFILDFVCAMFFGCQYETISPERFLAGKLKTE